MSARSILTGVFVAFAACGAYAQDSVRTPSHVEAERELQALEDIDSVKRLQRAYGHYVDRGYWREAADLFADQGTFEWGQDGVYSGKARILEYLVRSGGGNVGPGLPYGQLNHHMQLQPVVTVSADGLSAKARWRELSLLGKYKVSAHWGEGTYENAYVKEDGRWKIASLQFFPTFIAPYEGGWARLAPSPTDWRTRTSIDFPPDRPSTLAFQPWPSEFVPPFHYGDRAEGDVRRPRVNGPGEETAHLTLLRSRRDIETLQGRLGYYLDRGMWSTASRLFSSAATYEYGQSGVYVGPRHIRQALALAGPEGLAPGQLNIHMMLQPIIDVTPDNRTARARWRSDVMLARSGKGYWGEGVYENEYVNEGGIWKVSAFRYHPTYLADYDKGWGDGSVPLAPANASLPPDRPSTTVFKSFPDTQTVPFHYPHPVADAVAGAEWSTPADASQSALRERISRLEDHDAIEKVQRAYGYYVDKNLWRDVANLFAEDGTLEIGGRGVFVTRPHILAYLQSLGPEGPSPGFLMNHQQFQGIVSVDPGGHTASGRWTAFVMAGRAPDADWGVVVYENRYAKVNGVWQIKVLHAPFTMYTDYKDGWAKSASPITRPDSWTPPPDYPPSVLHNNYPSFHVEPYHYANPVTGNPFQKPNPAAGGIAPMRPLP